MMQNRTYRNTGQAITPNPHTAMEMAGLALPDFDPVTLEEMDQVKLMDRFDKKFLFPVHKLQEVLSAISKSYRVLQINEKRIMSYTSMYYDTLGFVMYNDHHNRKLNRFKIRKREYLDSGDVFLEIKFKSNKGRTRKKRIEISNRHMAFCKDEKKFIKKLTPYRPKMLYPSINNNFERITLVHKSSPERVTLDLNLTYRMGEKNAQLASLCVAEIKQSRNAGTSDIEHVFRQNRILPMNFSKYCMGLIMVNPSIKYNRFKQKFIQLKKINNDSGYAPFYK
jgi:hypothetical protein